MQTSNHSETKNIRVLVVDDTRIHTQLLADALRRDPQLEMISPPASSRDLVETVKRQSVQVVVLSSSLDEEPSRGFEVLRQLRASDPGILVIMLLDSSKRETILQAFRAGARGIFSRHGFRGNSIQIHPQRVRGANLGEQRTDVFRSGGAGIFSNTARGGRQWSESAVETGDGRGPQSG